MPLKYGFPASLQRAENIALQLSCTQTAASLTLPQTSKSLLLQNVGVNTVYVTFDGQPASTTNSMAIPANAVIQAFDIQANKINAICASSQTADLRVLMLY